MQFGMRVKIKFQPWLFLEARCDGQEYRNVTEIHYGYQSPLPNRIAFESDIHQTGCTWSLSDLAEIEITQEIEKAETF